MEHKFLQKVFASGPWNILLDRSRDFGPGETVLRLAPESVFRVTEARRRFPPRRYRDYDIIALCSTGLAKYAASELRALRAFVRRGGGLLLAATPGGFEAQTGRPIAQLALNQVAALFGFRFLSTAALPADQYGYRGYGRERLELTPAARRLTGLTLGDLELGRVGGLAVPARATALLRDKSSRTPVFALGRFGRGRVLVCADLALWNQCFPVAGALLLRLVAPRPRKRKAPPLWLDSPTRLLARDNIRVRYYPRARTKTLAILKAAREVRAYLARFFGRACRRAKWELEVHPGLGVWPPSWRSPVCRTAVGEEVARPALYGGLARLWAENCLYGKAPWWPMGRNLTGGLAFALELRCLEHFGFPERAAHLRRSCRGGKWVDLGKYYSESQALPLQRRFWLEYEERFGPRALAKLARVLMAKDTHPGILDAGLWTGFERAAWFAARAVGDEVYGWLARQGHTVRRIPLGEPKSARWKKALDDMLVRLAEDPREPPDARGDALRVLAARLGEKKVSLADCARQGRGARPDTSGLPAAVRLAEAKDARGRPALRRFLGSSDTGLAAVAALHLVFELGDREAADALARLAGRFNSRFKLAAGYALGLVGHPASERFSFRRVPGCRIEIVRDGLNKAFAMVDGYARANVWSLPQFYSASHGQAYSTHYVRWVHADALWRRRGLARAAMAGCLKSSRWDRLCSTSSLHTGVENVAHALYRSFGFNDIHAFTSFKKDLRTPLAAARPPRGVKLRRARSKDAAETAAFINRLHASLDQTAARLGDWPGDETAWLAWRDGKIVGVASAEAVAGRASLEVFEIAEFKEKEKKGKKDKPRREGRPPPPDRREQTAQALLAALHRTLKRAKTWEVEGATWRLPADKFHYWQLRRAGYGTHAAGGVELHRLNSLPQFLRETRPMFEKRLAASAKWRDWHGRVRLCAGHETATLRFQRGRVAVETDGRGQADMEVRGDRATFVRLLLACGSPFAAALQLDVRVRAGFNGSARELLDVLFPRLYAE